MKSYNYFKYRYMYDHKICIYFSIHLSKCTLSITQCMYLKNHEAYYTEMWHGCGCVKRLGFPIFIIEVFKFVIFHYGSFLFEITTLSTHNMSLKTKFILRDETTL